MAVYDWPVPGVLWSNAVSEEGYYEENEGEMGAIKRKEVGELMKAAMQAKPSLEDQALTKLTSRVNFLQQALLIVLAEMEARRPTTKAAAERIRALRSLLAGAYS